MRSNTVATPLLPLSPSPEQQSFLSLSGIYIHLPPAARSSSTDPARREGNIWISSRAHPGSSAWAPGHLDDGHKGASRARHAHGTREEEGVGSGNTHSGGSIGGPSCILSRLRHTHPSTLPPFRSSRRVVEDGDRQGQGDGTEPKGEGIRVACSSPRVSAYHIHSYPTLGRAILQQLPQAPTY